jgi:Family of unknown function (DUF6152)
MRRCKFKNAIRRFLLTAVLLSAANAAWAHHSFAMFDQTRRATLQGTVKLLEWTNPHVWLWVDGSDAKGGTATYGFETNAPAELSRFFGWSKSVLKSGDRITVEYAPLRSGNNGGALIRLTFADGRELLTPRSNTPPPVGLANPAGQK